jgi:UDP-N-acetylglucosamine 2-epimerase (non-hydrolysing)
MSLPEVHLVGGSRAEAVRLAPVAVAMREQGRVDPVLVAAGPDPLTFAETLGAFDLAPDLTVVATADDAVTVTRLDRLWSGRTPGAIVVQGDSGAALPAALAANWRRVPVVHLDAGRRAGYLGSATPDESSRRLLAQLATVHLAAAPLAAMNLFDEKVTGGDVLLTGNTAVDAARMVRHRRQPWSDPALAELRSEKLRSETSKLGGETAGPRSEYTTNRLLVVGADHTEAISLDLLRSAIWRLVGRYADLDVVMLGAEPGGLSPRVAGAGPLPYADRARLLAEAYLLITDDADLQEEALAFGVPSLIMREMSDRMEPLHAGCARLVGTSPKSIFGEAATLLDSRVRRDAMTAGGNPYGDGLAAGRAAQAAAALLGHGSFPDPMPAPQVAGVAH